MASLAGSALAAGSARANCSPMASHASVVVCGRSVAAKAAPPDIATTAKADLEACGHLVRFFEAADPRGLQPRDELAAADTDYVLAGGERYILYGSNVRKGLGLKARLPGTWTLRWLDCVTGKTIEQTNARPTASNATFAPPKGFGREIALYVRHGH